MTTAEAIRAEAQKLAERLAQKAPDHVRDYVLTTAYNSYLDGFSHGIDFAKAEIANSVKRAAA